MKLKTILFICCLMSVANIANAGYGITQNSDGSLTFKGDCKWRSISGTDYLCCTASGKEKCLTEQEWIDREERLKGTEYSVMGDMQSREQFDRHSSRHFNFEDRGLKGFLKKIF